MKIFTISASLKFKEDIRSLLNEAKTLGMNALFPNLDSGLSKDELTSDTARWLTLEHFEAIDKSEALYVYCPEGYIGKSVILEIGYAQAKNIPIYYSEPANDLVLDSLCTKVIPREEIRKLKNM